MSPKLNYPDKKTLFKNFIFVVQEMRRFQTRYFKDRDKDDMFAAKKYEKRVDELLHEIANWKE